MLRSCAASVKFAEDTKSVRHPQPRISHEALLRGSDRGLQSAGHSRFQGMASAAATAWIGTYSRIASQVHRTAMSRHLRAEYPCKSDDLARGELRKVTSRRPMWTAQHMKPLS